MRVLFSAMPVHSHIAPVLPLAVAMGQAGHDVLFATGEDRINQVRASGLEATKAGWSGPEVTRQLRAALSGPVHRALSPAQRLVRLSSEGLIGIIAPVMAIDLVPLARRWQPDLLVSAMAEHAGGVAAAIVGVPSVVHGFGPPKMATGAGPVRRAEADLYSRWGVEAPSVTESQATPYLDIWPRGLSPVAHHWRYPNMWPLQPTSVMPTPGPRPAVLENLPYQRTVYATSGTTYNARGVVLAQVVEALRDAPVNVIVTVGPDGDLPSGPRPQHIRVERYIRQETILPFCDLVVCHGGAGTVLGALAHAVPLVIAPVASDHHEVAAQVEAAGVGLTCPPPVSAPALLAAVHEVSESPRFTNAAGRLRDEIVSMPSPGDIVRRLEMLVGTSAPRG